MCLMCSLVYPQKPSEEANSLVSPFSRAAVHTALQEEAGRKPEATLSQWDPSRS
jgi:hypothetical protein